MNIQLNVVQNSDGTHTVSWEAGGVSTKLHTLMVSLIYDKPEDFDWETTSKGLYTWAYWNPNNNLPQYNGSITFNPAVWKPDWTAITYRAYICEYNTVDSPNDEYNCTNAPDIVVLREEQPPAQKSPAKKKK